MRLINRNDLAFLSIVIFVLIRHSLALVLHHVVAMNPDFYIGYNPLHRGFYHLHQFVSPAMVVRAFRHFDNNLVMNESHYSRPPFKEFEEC